MAESGVWKPIYDSSVAVIGDYRCACRDDGMGREEHSNTDEIVFPRRGVFTKHLTRRRAFMADANYIVYFNRNEPYRISHPAAERDRCTTLYMRGPTLLEAAAARDPHVGDRPERPFGQSHAPSSAAVAALHVRLLRRIALDPSPDLRIDELALDLFSAALPHAGESCERQILRSSGVTRHAHLDLVERTRIALSETFHAKVTLAELAARVHSSPFHLARVFRLYSGLSLHTYRMRLRLRAALDRFADGDVDLTGVALDCGFFDHSHFTNAFRGEFGISPREFLRPSARRQLREMSTDFQVQSAKR